ncbi:DUF3108 domain-containing protein [Ramlibacter sp. USB13]|uniref:DUF3108 domain-containing protein n=1 Tax=Ramlibacter cellulosilyticus TaxID=2764187 RepID=A0A923MQS4_9BURK|nr:DUF3108 domain-containing protein [Ramlibacter cellulosilyticus]MBC5782864.1 DUF3108 domain-containing protein [Ramlibacter cellulosilyticus]
MILGRHGRRKQLALLTVAVLAVHLLVLRPRAPVLAPERTAGMPFATRTLAPPALPPSVAAAAMPPPAATRVVRPAPAPRSTRPAAAPAAAKPATAGTPPRATPWPDALTAWPSAVLHYELEIRARGASSQGEARLDWRQDGQRYEARLELAAPGRRPRVQQSTGAIGPQGLVPERFSDRSRGEQATHFDPATGRIVFSNNQPQADWVAGVQDRLSVVLQLALLAAAQPARFVPGTEVVLPTATTRDAQAWTFRVTGEEDLVLPGGTVAALKLERPPRGEYDQRVELWLAPGQAYAPVRLRLTNPDGGWVDQRWSSTDRR